MSRIATLTHDDICYEWPDVPDKKYQNWVRMQGAKPDTNRFAAPGFPFMLQIEPTNYCNLACTVCPSGRNELNRDRRHMTLEEFKAIIDDMGDYLLFLIMWDWGEPLLNPQLPAMIKYASDRDLKTVTSTNGHFLNDESYLEELLNSGLTTIIVAIDSLSAENYEAYRKKGSLNKALEGLKRLIEVKKRIGSKTMIVLRMVIMKQNEHELHSMRRTAELLGVDRFIVKTANPTCGTVCMDHEIVPKNPRFRRYEYKKGTFDRVRVNIPCNYIWHMSNIHSNGNIVPCTCDYNGEMIIGNLREHKFSELWNSPAYCVTRKKVHEKNEAMAKCQYCDSNFALSPSGWFVESIDFHNRRPVREKIQGYYRYSRYLTLRLGKKCLDSGPGLALRQWIKTIRSKRMR